MESRKRDQMVPQANQEKPSFQCSTYNHEPILILGLVTDMANHTSQEKPQFQCST
jgi:hypothetical protein